MEDMIDVDKTALCNASKVIEMIQYPANNHRSKNPGFEVTMMRSGEKIIEPMWFDDFNGKKQQQIISMFYNLCRQIEAEHE